MIRALFPALLGIAIAKVIAAQFGLHVSWYGPLLGIAVTCAWAKLKPEPAALANFPSLPPRREANV